MTNTLFYNLANVLKRDKNEEELNSDNINLNSEMKDEKNSSLTSITPIFTTQKILGVLNQDKLTQNEVTVN